MIKKIRDLGLLFFRLIFLGFDNTGFIDDAGEFLDDGLAVEFGGFFNTNKGEASATEEFFHVFWITADVVFGFCAIVEFDCANRAQSTFVAKHEVNSLIFDKAISFVAVLAADFMA